MDESSVLFLLISVVVILVVVLIGILIIAAFHSKNQANRQRKDNTINQSVLSPAISQKAFNKSYVVEWGEPLEIERLENIALQTDSNPSAKMILCPICRQAIVPASIINVICPKCGIQYHSGCFIEFEKICQNCGWRQT